MRSWRLFQVVAITLFVSLVVLGFVGVWAESAFALPLLLLVLTVGLFAVVGKLRGRWYAIIWLKLLLRALAYSWVVSATATITRSWDAHLEDYGAGSPWAPVLHPILYLVSYPARFAERLFSWANWQYHSAGDVHANLVAILHETFLLAFIVILPFLAARQYFSPADRESNIDTR